MPRQVDVVITGASGFLGRAALTCCTMRGISAHGYSRERNVELEFAERYELIPGDSQSVLVHLAQSRDSSGPLATDEIELCRALLAKPWRHVVYASSAVVYGDSESHARRPDEPTTANGGYARTKIACEELVLQAGGTCLRFANVYGPGMASNSVIADILRQIPGREPLRLRALDPVRDFVWVDDAAACVVQAATMVVAGIFNVGNGRALAVRELARTALELAGEPEREVIESAPSTRASHLVLDIAMTRARLHWSPRVTIENGLAKLLATTKVCPIGNV